MNLLDLKKPFPEADIEWRVGRSGINNKGPWALVMPYITARAIQDRLDEVCGPENWSNDFREGPQGGVLCGISIMTEHGLVTKWNGAENTNIEAVKGGLSTATKRAGAEWGIGRYLYKLEAGYADFVSDGYYSTKIKYQGKENWYKWNPPKLPEWALPNGKGMQKPKYAPVEELDFQDYHTEKEAIKSADNMEDLRAMFGGFFKSYQGNIEAQKTITDAYNVKKAELLGEN